MSSEEHNIPIARSHDRPSRDATAEERAEAQRAAAHNKELMQTLDDAWNAQDMETFSARHKDDVVVRWPGKEPTHGVANHRQESLDFFRTFPDQKVHNRPYKTLFASGDWTCSIARFTGTMKGSMKGADGKDIAPTNKSFDVDFCTVARWDNGQIVEENLSYDLVTFMKQIGLGK